MKLQPKRLRLAYATRYQAGEELSAEAPSQERVTSARNHSRALLVYEDEQPELFKFLEQTSVTSDPPGTTFGKRARKPKI